MGVKAGEGGRHGPRKWRTRNIKNRRSAKMETVVADTFLDAVQKYRETDSTCLKVSIGQLGRGSCFTPGFSAQTSATRLILRLGKNCERYENWTKRQQFVYIECDYGNNIYQQTTSPNTKVHTYSIRNLVDTVDISTDRFHDLQLTIDHSVDAHISKNKAVYDVVKTNKPVSIRIIQDASFVENISPVENFHVSFKYSILKVSSKGTNKLDCTRERCAYHCTVSVETCNDTSNVTTPPAEIRRQNNFVARSLLLRATAILGSHVLTEKGSVGMPDARLLIVNPAQKKNV